MNSSSIVSASTSAARRLRRLSTVVSSRVASTRTMASSSVSLSSANISSSSGGGGGSYIPTTLAKGSPASTSIPFCCQRRFMGSGGGSRGARGHGWWVNYRAGKGGRHLQGTYSHLDLESMAEWNDAVLGMGRKLAYLDVRVEALADDNNNSNNNTVHRLTLELATEVLPKATDNVLKLLDSHNNDGDGEGYRSSTLHRIEKGVGILGGLVASNPNHNPHQVVAPTTKRKMGRCHPSNRMKTSPTTMDVSSEKLVLHHLPGVVTMLQPRIGEIDSRFLVLSHNAPHLDGVSLAVGRLVDDNDSDSDSSSLETVQKWESSLITSHGVPTNVVLRVVDCGLLPDDTKTESVVVGGGEPKQQQM